MARGRPKGIAKTGGRQKGTPNKVTREVKEMVLEALSIAGGVDYLVEQAQKSPNAFLTLVGKVLPLEAKLEHDAGPNVVDLLSIIHGSGLR